jgi:hypothetical protein
MPIMFVDLIIIFVTYLSAAETGQAYDSHGLFNDEETMQLLNLALPVGHVVHAPHGS